VYDRFAGQLCEKRCRSPIEVNNAPGMQRYDKHYLRHLPAVQRGMNFL
jgi:hypothetical protein